MTNTFRPNLNTTENLAIFARDLESRFSGSQKILSDENVILIPSFVDVHVHLREPGFFYKETIKTGTTAAAKSGYAHVFSMPNLKPVPDSAEALAVSERRIAEGACVHVYPYGAITCGEAGKVLADLEAMAPRVVAFSDDGKGVQNDDMMREAMLRAKRLGDRRALRG